jgi:hypothetical protein
VSKDPSFKAIPLLFHSKACSSGDISENIQFAVLFGNFSVLLPPISMYHSNITNLLNIVEKISPPKSTVAFISDLKSPLVQVHSAILAADVTYFGPSAEVNKFKQHLQNKSPEGVFEDAKSGHSADNNRNPPSEFVARRDIEMSDRNRNTSTDNVEASVDQSSTSPFKSNNNKVTDLSSIASSNPKVGFLDRLASIDVDLDESDVDLYKFD